MMAKKLWNNKVRKSYYTSSAMFSGLFRIVRGFRDLPTFPVFEAACFENVELKEMDDTATVEEDITGFKCKKSFGNICFGPLLLDNVPIVPSTCSHNCKIAVVNRGVKKRARPLPGFWRRARLLIRELIPDPRRRVELGFEDSVRIDPIKFAEWYKHLSPSSKRGISLVRKHKLTLQKKDARVKGFVKRENTPCFGDKRLIQEFNPRLISGRTFEYQLKTGPITYTLSKTIAMFLVPDSCITYASGMTAEQVGKWFTDALKLFVYAKFCETDASGFDGSVSTEAIDAELYVYKYLGLQEKHLRALKLQKKTFGFCSNIKYSVEATRKSGDGNTSVGNTTINSLITHCIFRNIPYKAIILGDDGLIIFESEETCEVIAEKVRKTWEMAGFAAKVHVFEDKFLAQFCSGRFYPVNGGFKFGMKPFRGLSKIGFSIKDFHRLSDIEVHRKGVGLGLMATVGHIPFLRDVAYNYIHSTKLDAEAIAIESHKMAAEREDSPDEATYTFISHVYGISRQQITSLENLLRSCRFPSVIYVDFLSRCCDIDASERRIPGIASIHPMQFVQAVRDFISSHSTMPTIPTSVTAAINDCGGVVSGKVSSALSNCKSWAFRQIKRSVGFLSKTCVRAADASVEVLMFSMRKAVEELFLICDEKLTEMALKIMDKPYALHISEQYRSQMTVKYMRFGVLWALFASPLVEEYVKYRWGEIACVLIALVEALPHGVDMPLVFIKQLVLHYLLLLITRKSYVLGTSAHVVYNFVVMNYIL